MKSIILRKIDGVFGALWRSNDSRSGGILAPAVPFAATPLGMVLMTVALVALMWLFANVTPDFSALSVLGFAGITSPIVEKKSNLQKLYRELDVAQKEIAEGKVDQNRGDEIEAKAKEAEALQAEVDQFDRIERLAGKGRELAGAPALPNGAGYGSEAKADDADKVLGYVSPGALFTHSDEYVDFVQKQGAPQGAISRKTMIESFHKGRIPITRKMMESKAIPTLGADVLMPDRISEIVRTPEQQKLTLRDVLNVSGTNGTSVEYITMTPGADAAAPVAPNAAKPESNLTLGTATAPVRTLAVWIPVTEQQLQDVPQIQGMIDNELTFDLKRLEERQVLYGSGAGENLQGILTLAGVPLITRTVTNTTNIDRIRIGMTDILVAGGEPNATVVHPLDWEGIVLAKGTDNRYVWVLVTDPQTGNSRIWGLQVVETVSAKNPANLQRYLLVGDFVRGATLWDRQQSNVQVGWQNDDFTKNRRTVRAEERVAFGVKRPTFFAKYETATAV